jgi:hypothetical protein
MLRSQSKIVLGLLVGLTLGACADSNFKSATKNQTTKSDTADATPDGGPGAPLGSDIGSLPRAISKKPDAIQSTFLAAVVKDEALKFTLDTRSVMTDFRLTDINRDLTENKGSSKEFVGEVRHRQFANCMKKHDSLSLIRVESV